MIKSTVLFSFLILCLTLNAQVLKEVEYNNTLYQVEEVKEKDYKDEVKTYYKVKNTESTEVSELKLEKDQSYSSIKVEWIEPAFVFVGFDPKDNSYYKIDRVFVNDKGKLFRSETDYIYEKTDSLDLTTYKAQFPRGRNALNYWIRDNIYDILTDYGESSQINIVLNFTIDETGKVKDGEVLGEISEYKKTKILDKINNKMPNWIPASEKGKKVSGKYRLPINLR
ncbi:MAG: hypothetical protein ACK5IC_04320 [Moheibacter sp.]